MSADRSCQNAINERAVQHLAKGLTPGSTNTGSYCKARQRLPLPMVTELTRCSGARGSDQWSSPWHWRGRPTKIFDGTTAKMPDTLQNQAKYPQLSTQKAGIGFPICRIVAILCLVSGVVLNAAMGAYSGKSSGEQSLLVKMLDTFEKDDIVLGGMPITVATSC